MRKNLKKLICVLVMCLSVCGILPALGAHAKDIVIVIDPGHGRSETGATRTWNNVKYREEVLNLKIARYLKAELETYQGVKVYLTHNTLKGTMMDRQQRLLVAKNKKATALVSIHNNSTAAQRQTSMSGSFAAVPSTSKYSNKLAYAKNSRNLAKSILKELNSQVGLRNNGFWIDDDLGIILYGMKYKIPSMIIEHCFVNNPNDCKRYLKTEAQLRKMGVADATGIAKFYKLKKKGSAPAKNGWVTGDEGEKYYYIDDVKQTSCWTKIGGKYYYFNKNGVLQTGVIKIGTDYYLSNKNGVRQKGLVTYNGKLYYAGSKGKLYMGWKTVGGKTYYFGKSTKGAAYRGLKKIGKNTYYFGPKTAAMQKKWITVSKGRKLFFNRKDGRMMKNTWLKWGGKWYYLGSNGEAYKSVKKKIDGKVYKFNSEGICTNKK
ncbi:MAG: N-acetylmuramoyl-L-alanine amidase [Eubacteriales bacterium]|nr:N-acetylmuramoyl-L-alanine amidase [Eubacteriales bacterium]